MTRCMFPYPKWSVMKQKNANAHCLHLINSMTKYFIAKNLKRTISVVPCGRNLWRSSGAIERERESLPWLVSWPASWLSSAGTCYLREGLRPDFPGRPRWLRCFSVPFFSGSSSCMPLFTQRQTHVRSNLKSAQKLFWSEIQSLRAEVNSFGIVYDYGCALSFFPLICSRHSYLKSSLSIDMNGDAIIPFQLLHSWCAGSWPPGGGIMQSYRHKRSVSHPRVKGSKNISFYFILFFLQRMNNICLWSLLSVKMYFYTICVQISMA